MTATANLFAIDHSCVGHMYSGGNVLPWHYVDGAKHLTDVTAHYATSAEVMELARLRGWGVTKHPLVMVLADGTTIECTGQYGVYRTDTNQWLKAVVGSRYEVLQNEEAFDVCDSLAAEGEMTYETAGFLGVGEKVWILAKLPQTISVTGKDVIKPYTLFATSHDGSGAIRIAPVATRVVCQNTWRMAHNEGKATGHMFSIKHTKSAKANLEKARKIFGQIKEDTEKNAEIWQAMARKTITRQEFKEFAQDVVDSVYKPTMEEAQVPVVVERPAPATDGIDLLSMAIDNTVSQVPLIEYVTEMREERSSASRDMLSAILANYDKPTQTETGAAGTAWAALNAVTEYANHGMSYNAPKAERNPTRFRQDARFESVMMGKSANIADYAYEQVMKRFK